MIFRLTVLDARVGAEHDIEVSAAGSSPVGSLLAALPVRVDNRPCFVGEEQLDPDDLLESSPLTVGSYLSIGAPGPLTRPVAPHLVGRLQVLSGPDAGRSLSLRSGISSLGRSAAAELQLRDPKVSREHAQISAGRDGITLTATEAAEKANGVLVSGVRIDGPRRLTPGERFQVGDDLLEVSASPGPPAHASRGTDGRLEFDRAYAPTPQVNRVVLNLPVAPAAGNNARAMLTAMGVPLVLGVAMAAVMKQPAMLLFAAFTPITMGMTHFTERRQRRARAEQFDTAKQQVMTQMDQAVVTQTRVRHSQAPDPGTLAMVASGAVRGLWPRDADSDDALLLRVGRHDREAAVDVRGDPWADFEEPRLSGVPWTVDLRTTGVLGLVGPARRTTPVANWLLAQLGTLCSPHDVRIVVLAPDGDTDLAWTRWLPHVTAGDGSETPCAIGVTAATRAARLDELKQLISLREDAQRDQYGARFDHHVVVVLQGALALRKVPGIRELLHDGPQVGVYSICIDTRDMIDCRGLIRLDSPDSDLVTASGQRSELADTIEPERISSRQAEAVARALAPMRDRLSARDDPGALPYPQRFLDLLGIERITTQDVLKLWDEQPGPTLEVPLGSDAQGPVTVDLAGQGPHTMLAGATGAGKSILLQTLVTSLLLANRPDELNLVLVDFKGGSAFLPFEHCPHVVALIRNTEDDPAQKFDEAAAQRVLASVRAEVRRRESILGRHGGEIDAYWRARARDGNLPALPRLVMVFDEYARAMDASPDFPKELMAVAGKGRSLGMHLVFATQSLQGKLSPEMKNNISLRITLRQNEKSDSVEVLGVPDAVTIPGRFKGRGLILCTLDESRQPRPFQSGYLGDPPPDGRARPAQIRLVEWKALGLPRPEARSQRTVRETDQTLAIAAVEEAAARSFPGPVKRPLLPPLPAQLRPEQVPPAAGSLVFGLADDPENQEQPVVALDLAGTDRWMIAGGPQSGRTTALRALLQSAASLRGEQVQTYVIANRDGELSSFAGLPNCGAVMHLGEPDRVRRLVTWLGQEVQRRTRERFTSTGSRPAIVVLVDGWEGLENRGQGLFDETSVLTTLYEVISGGPPVGVHVVVTGGQVMVSGRLPDLYNRRILLAFPSESARRAAMGGAMTPPPHLPGRGIETATGCHVQIAHAGPTITRTVAMPSPGTSPQHFAPMPYEVPVDDRTLWAPATSATWIPVGRGGPQVEPVGVDLFGEDPHLLLISGPEGSGRSTSAAAAVLALRQVGVPVLVIAPPRSPLHRLLGESADLRLLSGTSWADEQLRQAAAPFEGGQYAVVMDDLDQMKVEAGTVNFAPAPTLLDDLADPASAGRRALVLCGNAGPVLDGAVRSLARVVESSVQGGTRLVLSPSSIFAARQMGITLERDQILPVGPGRGFVTVRRAVQPIQAALLPRKSPLK